MKIGIDIRALVAGRHSGVETYTVQFLAEIFALYPDDEFVLFFNAYHDAKMDLAWTEKYHNVRIKRTRIPNKLLNFSLWYFRWPKIDRLIGGVDVFFMPNINFCAVSKDTRLIVTVHDLSFEHYPQTFSWKRRAWHFFVNPRALAHRAEHIITVSDATRNDVMQTYDIAPEKITTIHSALGTQYRVCSRNDLRMVNIKEKYNLPYRFILFLGTIEPRKNIAGLIEAYDALQKNYGTLYRDIPLVIAGGRGWKDATVRTAIEESPYAEKIKVLGFIEEEDKPLLYNLASVFVYPSFFEGFGFPPLEAMACGTPVITSNTSSLPEIVGSGAVMIDPDRPEEITHALHHVLSDRSFSQKLHELGLVQTTQLSWHRAAQKFREVLGSKNS